MEKQNGIVNGKPVYNIGGGKSDFGVEIKLAKNKNVFIESGGITWLFNEEFYPYPSAIKAII